MPGIFPVRPDRSAWTRAGSVIIRLNFLVNFLRRVGQKHRIVITLAHLSPVQSRAPSAPRSTALPARGIWDVNLIETPHNLASQFDVGRLVDSDRDFVGFIDRDVGRLQDRIAQKAVGRQIFSTNSLSCSLYVGLRSSHGTGVIIEKSKWSSACSLTRDWRNNTELSPDPGRRSTNPSPSRSCSA